MDLGLAGKHALVTGSTAGIGYAIVKGLAAEGASVVVIGRTQGSVDAALKRLREYCTQLLLRSPGHSAGDPERSHA